MSLAVASEGRRGRLASLAAVLTLVFSSIAAVTVWAGVRAHAATGLALLRTGWTATASASNAGEPPSNMLDGNSATRWSSGAAMANGQSITVDMAAARTVGEITMDSAGSSGDYARGSQVFVSNDGSSWGSAVATGTGSSALIDVAFAGVTARFIKVVQTGSAANWWSVAEFNAYAPATGGGPVTLSRAGWIATASSSAPGDATTNMLDGSAATRWSTGVAMANGQWVVVDMATAQTFSEIKLDAGSSGGDYARGYQVFVSSDGATWGTALATGSGSAALIDIVFSPKTARYIKVVQTGSASSWWSIAEFNAYLMTPTTTSTTTSTTTPTTSTTPTTTGGGTPGSVLPRAGWTVTASSSGPGDVPANMIDGAASTRWSTGATMANGQWVIVDMGASHSFGEIKMDSATSAGDYARGYQVFVSTDGNSWGSSVATGSGSSSLIDVMFPSQNARYVKVLQTGSASSWWSIAEFNAYVAGGTGTAWVGGWGPALAGYGNGINNQTVRMVVHNTVLGTSVRVRLSNQYGANPLSIGAVDIAVQSSGATAVAGTRHIVTFGGSGATTVAAHADLASDPIAMTVSSEQNLLVSIYFSGNAGTSSWHWDAQELSYYSAAGNFAADDAAGNYPANDHAWYYLDGLDVQSTTAKGTVVAFGDSITDGSTSTQSANNRWPNYLARRLQSQANGPSLGVVDAGIGGNRLLTDTGNQFGTSALHRFAHDALAVPAVKDVILLEGINDIGVATGPNGALTSQDLINGYQTLIAQSHAAGVRIFGSTILPYQGYGTYNSNGESIRETVNNWILTSGAFDGVFDLAAAAANPSNPLQLNPAYDSGDHIHPNDAGYNAMANAIDISEL